MHATLTTSGHGICRRLTDRAVAEVFLSGRRGIDDPRAGRPPGGRPWETRGSLVRLRGGSGP